MERKKNPIQRVRTSESPVESPSHSPSRNRAATETMNNQLSHFESILSNPNTTFPFYLFLKNTHSEENYLFYRAVQDYKATEDSNIRLSKGKRIFVNYLKPGALKSVNVDFSKSLVESALQGDAPKDLFEEQERQAKEYLHNLYFLRFLQSEEHNSFVKNRTIKLTVSE